MEVSRRAEVALGYEEIAASAGDIAVTPPSRVSSTQVIQHFFPQVVLEGEIPRRQ